ncbi:MAG: RagB/SusD family nutrient uptake outer membrane protein [Flavobacteriaceae bacterium]|jgi:hypothetical protein
MKNFKSIFWSSFLVLLIFSCADDFIDVPSKNPNADDFFNTEKDYEDVLIGTYDLLQSTFWNVLIGEIASDNTLAGGDPLTIDQPSIQQIDAMTHNDVNIHLRDIWSFMYGGMNRANYILEFKDKSSFDNHENIIGQAYFLRAYFTFELVKWFGNIPLYTEEINGLNRIRHRRVQFGEQYSMERVADIPTAYELIEADLLDAINMLPVSQPEDYKITKGAAQSLLGKLYLFHGKYDSSKFTSAAEVLDQVIESNQYSLVSDYASIFEHKGENGPGSVFEVQYTDVEGASFDCLQCSEGNVTVGFSGIRSYSGNTFDSGYGFNTPTQEVVDQFEEGDLRKEVAILDIAKWKEKYASVTYSESRGNTGYYNRKYIPRKGDLNLGDNNLTNPNNYRAIRYADVLLMAAEAHNRKPSPNDQKAKDYLNQVRRRAFGVSNDSKDVTSTGSQLTQAIYHERRVELVGEGHHFFDLVRTERAANEIENFVPNKNEIFPIPKVELELSNAIERWGQNPGY